jgi:hypothetical protein
MPYMTHQVMTLIPVERPGLGTMAVDEYCRMYFDPAFLEGRDLKHLAFVVLHEAIHVWSRHAKTVPGTRRQTVIVSVLESLRQHVSTFMLSSVIEEIRRWCETGRSCFARWVEELGLTGGGVRDDSRLSLLDRVIPVPDG